MGLLPDSHWKDIIDIATGPIIHRKAITCQKCGHSAFEQWSNEESPTCSKCGESTMRGDI